MERGQLSQISASQSSRTRSRSRAVSAGKPQRHRTGRRSQQSPRNVAAARPLDTRRGAASSRQPSSAATSRSDAGALANVGSAASLCARSSRKCCVSQDGAAARASRRPAPSACARSGRAAQRPTRKTTPLSAPPHRTACRAARCCRAAGRADVMTSASACRTGACMSMSGALQSTDRRASSLPESQKATTGSKHAPGCRGTRRASQCSTCAVRSVPIKTSRRPPKATSARKSAAAPSWSSPTTAPSAAAINSTQTPAQPRTRSTQARRSAARRLSMGPACVAASSAASQSHGASASAWTTRSRQRPSRSTRCAAARRVPRDARSSAHRPASPAKACTTCAAGDGTSRSAQRPAASPPSSLSSLSEPPLGSGSGRGHVAAPTRSSAIAPSSARAAVAAPRESDAFLRCPSPRPSQSDPGSRRLMTRRRASSRASPAACRAALAGSLEGPGAGAVGPRGSKRARVVLALGSLFGVRAWAQSLVLWAEYRLTRYTGARRLKRLQAPCFKN
ncbi:hypothetical protein M885DRAFT_122699 [Pelagophyceae sp. CCMP2097]|nr:hypothetical protein M885DRAFT_122699 [Pelagophyceae sp. CCMP2097]